MNLFMKNKAFTLIELLVVVAIIGILATVVVVNLTNAQKKSRDAIRLSDMSTITTALDLYYNDKQTYPLNRDDDHAGWDHGYFAGDGATDFIKDLPDNGYLAKVPGDPLSKDSTFYYRYLCQVPHF